MLLSEVPLDWMWSSGLVVNLGMEDVLISLAVAGQANKKHLLVGIMLGEDPDQEMKSTER